MASIDEQIDIDVSAQLVWKVLTQIEKYPLWHPFITHVNQSPAAIQTDETFLWTTQQAEGPQQFQVAIEYIEPETFISFLQSKADQNVKERIRESYALHSQGNSSCLLIRRIEFIGFPWLFGLMLRLFYQRQQIDEDDVLEAIQKYCYVLHERQNS